MSDQLHLKILKVPLFIQSNNSDISDWIRFDFHYFLDEGSDSPSVTIAVNIGPIPSPLIPPVPEVMHTPQYVCYERDQIRYIDYYGRAVAVFDPAKESIQFFSNDVSFAYEKLYLMILSRSGEILDRQGFHRVHALGVAIQDKAALFLMPEHGGKSTLAVSLLKNSGMKLISDESPFINDTAHVFPFPFRIGIHKEEVPGSIPAEMLRTPKRDDARIKSLIKPSYFDASIQRVPLRIGWIFVGQWIYSDEPSIKKLSRFKAFKTLVRDCVLGLGLAQVFEYFLRAGLGESFGKLGILWKRTMAAIAIVRRSDTYLLHLSRNPEKNRDCIMKFFEES